MFYFVSLSMIIAVCAALISGVVNIDATTAVPTLENNDFMTFLIVGFLFAYLVNKGGEFAKKISGSIDEKGFGDKLGGDIKKLWGNTQKTATSVWKAVRGTK